VGYLGGAPATGYYVRAARFLEGHPVVSKDEIGTASRPLFLIAQSWETTATDGIEQSILYQTSDQAFGKPNLREVAQDPDRAVRESTDLAGPLSLAVALSNSRNNARLLVFGDADWLRDDQIVAFDGQFLWTNAMDWLTGFLQRVTVTPVAVQLPLNVSGADLDIAALLTLVALPATILLSGAVAWWRRARR
jgi:ABC-2 type transport system permease protein